MPQDPGVVFTLKDLIHRRRGRTCTSSVQPIDCYRSGLPSVVVVPVAITYLSYYITFLRRVLVRRILPCLDTYLYGCFQEAPSADYFEEEENRNGMGANETDSEVRRSRKEIKERRIQGRLNSTEAEMVRIST